MSNFLIKFISNITIWYIINIIFIITNIIVIQFKYPSLRLNFWSWTLNLLLITILIWPIIKLYNKYIKSFIINNINNENIKNKIKKISILLNKLILYRRHLWILTFSFGTIHWISYLILYWNINIILNTPYLIFWILTLILLFIGFITSNNFSQKLLKKHWKTIQTISAYGALLTVSFHLNFIEFGEGISYLILFIILLFIKLKL